MMTCNLPEIENYNHNPSNTRVVCPLLYHYQLPLKLLSTEAEKEPMSLGVSPC